MCCSLQKPRATVVKVISRTAGVGNPFQSKGCVPHMCKLGWGDICRTKPKKVYSAKQIQLQKYCTFSGTYTHHLLLHKIQLPSTQLHLSKLQQLNRRDILLLLSLPASQSLFFLPTLCPPSPFPLLPHWNYGVSLFLQLLFGLTFPAIIPPCN